MHHAILVHLEVATPTNPAVMVASCLGARSIEHKLEDLPIGKGAGLAIASLMCHQNKWPMDLVGGILPNGDEVFCQRVARSL